MISVYTTASKFFRVNQDIEQIEQQHNTQDKQSDHFGFSSQFIEKDNEKFHHPEKNHPGKQQYKSFHFITSFLRCMC